jgi:hypothetical protein
MRISNAVQAVALATPLAVASATCFADSLTPVPSAQPKLPGVSQPVVLSPELIQYELARGSFKLENPDGLLTHYGYNSDVTNAGGTGPQMLPAPGDVQSTTHNVEASKTEPDKNTYLVFPALSGLDPKYDYGRHFLFQGHETGKTGYITRINLDADYDHRVTLLASKDINNAALPLFDGSTWYPWAHRLLFTSENGPNGGVWQATPNYPSLVVDLSGIMGRGGYEGIQADSDGNIWIVEDVGGASYSSARQPNSFVYRFIPYSKYDLTKGGKLQVLQVQSLAHPGPIVFHAGDAQGDILSQDSKDLHTYGKVFKTKWVQIHDTATDPVGPFNANQLAKDAGGTPFRRPENGQFRPGSHFTEFYFDETGDTNANTAAGRDYGGFGSILRLKQADPSANEGTLTLFYLCDKEHSGFDNVAFWSDHELVFVEDAGDTLHTQRNALDSAYLFDVRQDYSSGLQPVRILAQGRDPSATIDSAYGSVSGTGFQNEGDNEITGIHVSDGDPTPFGLLGAKTPRPSRGGWRVFYTQQHGDNVTYEILANPALNREGRGHDGRD